MPLSRATLVDIEQELLADTTFRPRINAASSMAVSKLKVVSDPGNYIATVEVGPSVRAADLLILTSSDELDVVGNIVGNVVRRCQVEWKSLQNSQKRGKWNTVPLMYSSIIIFT